jgi:hypothetical protein
MISQKCPVCRSKRIRKGYRPTRFWSKLMFRYNLLCNNCNWEFIGFAIPLFASTKQTKSSRERKPAGKNLEQPALKSSEMQNDLEKQKVGTRKKIRIRA